jgi:hypothetical protein
MGKKAVDDSIFQDTGILNFNISSLLVMHGHITSPQQRMSWVLYLQKVLQVRYKLFFNAHALSIKMPISVLTIVRTHFLFK